MAPDDVAQNKMAPDAITETQQKIEALKLRLDTLEGKANKKERTQVNKEIYALENDESYVAAVKARVEEERARSAAADDAAHVASLAQEAAMAAARQKASTNPGGAAAEMYERHFRQQVEQLFDEYAPKFERSLCVDLKYRTPQELERVLLSRAGRSEADQAAGVLSHSTCVDFGCGTGLMGVLLRARCTGRLIGCDLSRGMLEVAERAHAGVYDELDAADAVSYLRKQAAGSADLVVGADVCVYMRQLVDLVAAAAAALSLGGILAFSTEACRLDEVVGGLPPNGDGWVERKSERIAHSEEYLRWLVAEASSPLQLLALESSDIRNDGKEVIRGHLVLMQKVQ